MNKATKFNSYMDYVEQRLEHWAKWFSMYNDPDSGLGFRSYTREYVLMTLGTLVQTSKIKPLPYNEEAEEIEDIVSHRAKYDEKIAKMLCAQYIGKGAASERAKMLGISYSRFRPYVDMARYWVAARLSASKMSVVTRQFI